MLNQILNRINENEEETFITVKNVRVFAVFICVFAVLVSLFFGAAKEVALGAFLGGAAAQLVFRQHEIAIGKSLFSGSEKNGYQFFIKTCDTHSRSCCGNKESGRQLCRSCSWSFEHIIFNLPFGFFG